MAIFYLISKIPFIILTCLIIYLVYKFFISFCNMLFRRENKTIFESICIFFDPYKQSFFNKITWKSFLIFSLFLGIMIYFYVYTSTELLDGKNGKYIGDNIFYNIIVYFPNYLIHEFSHRFFAHFRFDWLTTFAGNFIECLIPFIVSLFFLQLKGGNFFRCISLYWLSTAFYDAGIYVADARASLLALTSSDMVSNFNSGIVKGDWYYILSPLGLLEYDIIIGNIFKIWI